VADDVDELGVERLHGGRRVRSHDVELQGGVVFPQTRHDLVHHVQDSVLVG
jgi:hypothetical protein